MMPVKEQPVALGVASFYMLTSILLIYFNKAAFSHYAFSAPNVLTLSQTLCSFLLLHVFKRMKWIEFQSFSMHNFIRLLPIGLSFIAYMVFGMFAMQAVNIPMYTTLRRTTVVFVMLLEYVVSKKSSNVTVKLSVAVMILGALIAGYRDLNFDLSSYLLVMVYNFFTALYLVLINAISTEEKKSPTGLTSFDYMYYNNLIGLPLLVMILVGTNEVQTLEMNPYLGYTGFWVSLIASSFLAFALNYSIFWNTAVNSALTQTVSGQAKDIIVVLLGFLAFSDAHVEWMNLTGIAIGFVGSVLYALTKMYPTMTIETLLGRTDRHGYGHSHSHGHGHNLLHTDRSNKSGNTSPLLSVHVPTSTPGQLVQLVEHESAST